MDDLGYALSYARVYLALLGLGQRLKRDAEKFDDRFECYWHFINEQKRVTVQIKDFHHSAPHPGDVHLHPPKERPQAPAEIIPSERYIKYYGVWKSVGSVTRNWRSTRMTTEEEETNDEIHWVANWINQLFKRMDQQRRRKRK